MTVPSNDELKTLLLDHYHCTFFLPLLGFGEGIEPKGDLKKTYPFDEELGEADAEAFYYFTPTLRDIVFDREERSKNELRPVQEWHLGSEQISKWRLELLPSQAQQKEINNGRLTKELAHQSTVFQAIHLYRYFNGIYLLAFRVRPEALTSEAKQQLEKLNVQFAGQLSQITDPNQITLTGIPIYPNLCNLQLEAWLRFTRLARQLYPTFTEQWNEEKIAPLELTVPELAKPIRALDGKVSRQLLKSANHLSSILLHLVQQFFSEDIQQKLKDEIRLFDDRMFVSVAYGLAGAKHDEDTRNRVKALITTTDRFEDTWSEMEGYAYTKTALDRMMQNTEFDWWAGKGGHFIYNDMVNGYLYNGWFFREVIAPKHIPYIYDRMLIQALFYQASLRDYDHQITVKTTALLEPQKPDNTEQDRKAALQDIQKQRGQFIEFTNQYWFREVTNQMQGKEIFRLQQQGLGLQEHYALLQDEITRTDEYLQALHEIRLAEEADNAGKRAHQFTKLAAVLALVAAIPIFNDIFKSETSLWQSIATSVANTLCLSVFSVKVSLALVLALLLLGTFIYFWRRKD